MLPSLPERSLVSSASMIDTQQLYAVFGGPDFDAAAWRVKGEGAANLVLAYCGDNPHLHGVILRVRKKHTAKTASLDQAIWAGAMQWSQDPVERELAYVVNVVAPRLGDLHVYPGVPCPFPRGLLPLVGHSDEAALKGSAVALLLPDHTTFSAVPPNYRPAGPTVCLEIKPKCGFLPAGSPSTLEESESITLSYPRFVLHMVMKHVVNQQQLTHYNPLDLFSGDKQRMQYALWQLLRVPSNNLRVFCNGELVMGGRPGNVNASDAYATPTLELDDLQAALQGFWPDEATNRASSVSAGIHPPGPGLQLGDRPVLAALVKLAVDAMQNEGVLARLLEVQQLDRVGVAEASRAYQTFCETFTEVSITTTTEERTWMDAEGRTVMSEVDEAVTVVEECLPGTSVAERPPEGEPGSGQVTESTATGPPAIAEAEASSRGSAAARTSERSSSMATSNCASAGLSSAPITTSAGDQLVATLRDYLLAATAKDCGIMITLQRAELIAGHGAPASEGASTMPVADKESSLPTGASRSLQQAESLCWRPSAQAPGDGASIIGQLQQPAVRVLHNGCGPTATHHLYKVAFVDLDIKPSSKIPKHWELEQEIVACALQNRHVLEQLVQVSVDAQATNASAPGQGA